MESLSRRNQAPVATLSRKLSRANGFSSKNAYDDVFAGPPKFGAPNFSSRIEDYSEIFGSSRASSIPILDLSVLDETNVAADFRSSKPDYTKIFGGFRDEDIFVSVEELFDGAKSGKSSSNKAWRPSATGSPLQGSGHLNGSEENQAFSPEVSYQSFDAVKQFNMSYHKTSQRSKDETNVETHPGYTCLIGEISPPQNTEGDEQKPSVRSDVRCKMDFSKGILEGKNSRKAVSHLTNKQTAGGVVKSRSGSRDGSNPNDKLFNASEINLKQHPSKVTPPSSLPANLDNYKRHRHSKKSVASNFEAPKSDASGSAVGDCSPPFFGEELDINSAAATSAAALKMAIEKAQESIRIAKELMERNKKGLQSCSNQNSKDSLKVHNRRGNTIAHEGTRTKEKKAKETCERADAVLQVFNGMERKNALRSREAAPDFKDNESFFTARKFTGEKHAKNLQATDKCEAATLFSELVNTGKHRTAISALEHADSKNNILQTIDKHECKIKEEKTTKETSEWQEGIIEKSKAVEADEAEDMERKLNASMPQEWEENLDESELSYVVDEHAETEKSGIAQDVEETEEKQKGFYEHENCEKKWKGSEETIEGEKIFDYLELKENDYEKTLNEARELVGSENEQQEVPELEQTVEKEETEKSGIAQEVEETEEKQKVFYEHENCEKKWKESEETIEDEKIFDYQDLKENDYEKTLNEARELVGSENDQQEVPELEQTVQKEENEKSGIAQEDENCEKKLKESEETIEDEKKFDSQVPKKNDYEKRLNEARELVENEKEQQEVPEQEQNIENEENENIQRKIHIGEVIEKRHEEVFQLVEKEYKLKEACGSESNEKETKDVHKGDDTEKSLDKVHELEIGEARPTDDHDGKEGEMKLKEECDWEGNEKRVTGHCRYEETENIQKETDESEENENIKVAHEDFHKNNFNRATDACGHDASSRKSETQEASPREINDNKVEASQEVNDDNGSILGVTEAFHEFELEAEAAGLVEGAAEDNETENNLKDATEAIPSDDNAAKCGSTDMNFAQQQVEQNDKDSESASEVEYVIEILATESRESDEIVEDEIAFDEDEEKNNHETTQEERQWVDIEKELEGSHVPSVFTEKNKSIEIDEEINISRDTKENLSKAFTMEEKETKETVPIEVEEKEKLRKIDEANKREREWEKDRIVVERAIREARERAFAEVRERAERAVVERATAEVRQRVMAEAREKLEKPSAGAKSSAEKASIEAKLRAERAAVERATAEARERALEKALSQKITPEARAHAERFVAEKFSGASRDNATRQSFSSTGVEGTNTESAQRCKARLERHQRIMERAAKALAEKNRHDLLAQKEQAERNRLAETLDADIKRWSSGKEGNLRSLLSTLQYILGPGSGWQPISLTDIITTNAIRKAYKKATLHVHPDKLQQRGASIQQKYICEKIFDLLKAAWNKFDSEER